MYTGNNSMCLYRKFSRRTCRPTCNRKAGWKFPDKSHIVSIFFRFCPQPNITKIDILGLHITPVAYFSLPFHFISICSICKYFIYTLATLYYTPHHSTATFIPVYNNNNHNYYIRMFHWSNIRSMPACQFLLSWSCARCVAQLLSVWVCIRLSVFLCMSRELLRN